MKKQRQSEIIKVPLCLLSQEFYLKTLPTGVR